MLLHEAILKVLETNHRSMSTQEIADYLNNNNWYQKKDKSSIHKSQISARVNRYQHLFEINRNTVSIKHKDIKIRKKLILGNFYTKAILSELLDEYNLSLVREGLYYCKKSDSTFLFVDLVKGNKPKRFHFNDYFEGDYFHWDSQTTQHINSPKIQLETNNIQYQIQLFLLNRKL